MSLGCKCVEAFCCYVTFIQAIIVFYGIDCVVIKYGAELMLKCEVGPFSISNDARCLRCGFFFFLLSIGVVMISFFFLFFLKICDGKLLIG